MPCTQTAAVPPESSGGTAGPRTSEHQPSWPNPASQAAACRYKGTISMPPARARASRLPNTSVRRSKNANAVPSGRLIAHAPAASHSVFFSSKSCRGS